MELYLDPIMDGTKWERIKNLNDMWITTESKTLDNILNVKGIGDWTVRCALHMIGKYEIGGWVVGDRSVNNLLKKIFPENDKLNTRIPTLLSVEQGGLLFSVLWRVTRGSVKERNDWVNHVKPLLAI